MHTKQATAYPAPNASHYLPDVLFEKIIANAPLIAIDLIVEDSKRRMLLGWRNNPPAKASWFVPGGRVRKNESLDIAFARITEAELGQTFQREQSVFVGIYQHFYPDNFLGQHGATTHYLALAHRLWTGDCQLDLPLSQHAQYRWAYPDSIVCDPQVHAYTRAYFSSEKN
jgi:colanic acid biosynthesis protein WcaH